MSSAGGLSDADKAGLLQSSSGTSIARSSSLRFAGEAGAAAFGLATSLIVARHLGPTLKGTVSTLSYMVALFAPLCTFGLGEAGVLMISQQRATLKEAVSSTVGFLALTTTVGAGAVFGLSLLEVGSIWRQVLGPVAITAFTLPLAAFVGAFGLFVDSQNRVGFTGATRLLNAAFAAVATFILVDVFARWTVGAMLALAVGWVVALAMLCWELTRRGAAPVPKLHWNYLRQAIRFGLPVQGSYLVIVASARLDLLLVNVIESRTAAGLYSIALTIGTLGTYPPVAIAAATFPRVAVLGEEWWGYTQRITRMSLAASILVSAMLASTVSLFIPLLFGQGFAQSVPACLILIASGVPWSAEWILCRSLAARGDTSALMRSFLPSLIVMVALDLVMISRFGIDGAAEAYLLSSVIGMAIAVRLYVRSGPPGESIVSIVPTWRDVRQLVDLSIALLRGFSA